MSSENESKCLFCKWIKTEYKEVKEENRLLNNPDNDGYLVVLDRAPKVAGHTLIISKEHYADITEINNEKFKYDNFFRGVNKWACRIKDKLNEKLNEEFGKGKEILKKVYVLSMCDHWSKEELRKLWKKYSTEHLHFHLVPRYDFDAEIRGEEVLIRGVELKSEALKSKKLEQDKRKIERIYEILKDDG